MFDQINPLLLQGGAAIAILGISNIITFIYTKNAYKMKRNLHGDHLTAIERERIRDLVARGHTIHYISKLTGRGHSAVSRVRQDYFSEKQARSPVLPTEIKKAEVINPIVLNSKNTPLIAQEKKKIVDMFITGKPIEDMVKVTGRSTSTLYRVKDEYNALVERNKPKEKRPTKRRRYNKVDPESIVKMHRLVDEGLTFTEISRITKRPSSTVFTIVDKYKKSKNK